MPETVEIVIVGAGPTGLTLACQLTRRGVPCRLIDQEPEPTRMSRAIGVSSRTLEVLDELEAAGDAIDQGHRLSRVNFYASGRRIGNVSTAAPGTRYPFMLALPQSSTERLLEAHLERLGGRVERRRRLRDLRQEPGADSVTLTIESPEAEEHVEASWVVGADGAHSMVRKLSGIAFAGKAIDVVFVIVDAEPAEAPPAGEAHYFLSADGLLVVVPLPDGTYRLAATVRPRAASRSEVDLASVQELVDRRTNGNLRIAALHNAGWGAAQVQIHTRVAEGFRAGRCLLAGDAAHIYSPVGGQGMNGGIQDAHNLAWKLALVRAGKASDALLDTYASERHARAVQIMRETTVQTRAATIRSRLGRRVQRRIFGAISRPGRLNRRLVAGLGQLDIDYRGSKGTAGNGRRGPAGKRIPDTPLAAAPGAPPTLHGALRARPFTLLALSPGEAERATIAAIEESLRRRYGPLVGVRTLRRGSDGSVSDASALVDSGGELHDHLRVKRPSVCLVRPDAHVAYFGSLASGTADSLLRSLERILDSPGSRRSDAPEASPVQSVP